MSKSSDPRKAINDLVKEIKKIFKKHTRTARSRAWSAVTSKGAKPQIDKIIKSPSAVVNGTSSWLSYRDWVESRKTEDE